MSSTATFLPAAPYTVLIAGAGRIGSRHLQGLASSRRPLRIFVQDVSAASLARAEQLWTEASGAASHHEVSFHTEFSLLPRDLTLAIVATTADVRPAVVGKIAAQSVVAGWVLEKVLAQSESGLDDLTTHIGSNSPAWVNTSRRMMPWHQQMKSRIGGQGTINATVSGGRWGLACNAVHFLDLVSWWSGESIQRLVVESGDDWHQSKRAGFWDFAGTLEATYSGGSKAVISADESSDPLLMELVDSGARWTIFEAGGLARRSDGFEISGRVLTATHATAQLIDSLLERGACDLPLLSESAGLHRVLLRGLLEHWRRCRPGDQSIVPIT